MNSGYLLLFLPLGSRVYFWIVFGGFMRSRFTFGIFYRILGALLLVSLIPLAAIWAINFNTIRDLNNTSVEQRLVALNDNLLNQVNSWVDMNRRMLLQNARTLDIISMDSRRQNPTLKTMTELYDWAYLAFTVAPDGNNIGRSDGKKPIYYGDRSYFKQVMDGAPLGEQILIGKTSGKPALILSAPINNPGGQMVGVIAVAATLSEISDQIANSHIGETGIAFLVDKKGEVIAHPSEVYTRSRIDMSRHPAVLALKQGQKTTTFVNEEGHEIFATAQQNNDGWIMITQQDTAEAFSLISRENKQGIILLISSLLLILLVGMLVSKRLTRPIKDLTEVADQFSQGKLDLQISGLGRQDEIGNLARAIERLGTSIRLAMDRLQRLK
jgi:methyl-accepting chemotaxis protein